MTVVVITIKIGALRTISKGLERGLEELKIGGRIVVIAQNTEGCPGDQRRLAITQIPLKDHQKTLVRKIWKKHDNDNKDNVRISGICTNQNLS